ncbi:DNA-directed RNA polymerase subunit alpha [Patescibacteria group bacterium]|nr:DNA-directed RNA polymerase subunit alpha [Patescibacteria group bacterium]
MEKISLPKKIEFIKGKEPNQKSVIIEPCYPGYGLTLGNSLRRVLLSSLPGAAVVGVKIKGASHEFMALPNIKEDVLEIILNLKQLRLKIYGDEAVKLELDARGEKEAKAKDIKKNSQAEIVNPDLTLAHITDVAGSLNMEIYASRGKGYEMVESREEKKHEIGYIEIDSIFSPIRAVGINIENVRVGKMTNWDKLILDITTDGTITPEEAFNESVKILIKQFSFLIGAETEPEEKEAEPAEEEKGEEEKGEAKETEIKQEKPSAASKKVLPEKKQKRGRPKKN